MELMRGLYKLVYNKTLVMSQLITAHAGLCVI